MYLEIKWRNLTRYPFYFRYLKCCPDCHYHSKIKSSFKLKIPRLSFYLGFKTPKIVMFGPGLEAETSGIVKRIFSGPNSPFVIKGMFPGRFDGKLKSAYYGLNYFSFSASPLLWCSCINSFWLSFSMTSTVSHYITWLFVYCKNLQAINLQNLTDLSQNIFRHWVWCLIAIWWGSTRSYYIVLSMQVSQIVLVIITLYWFGHSIHIYEILFIHILVLKKALCYISLQ